MSSSRRILASTTVLVAAIALSGCSGSAASGPATTDDSSAFPVTIESSLGDAVIPEEPQRVVTLGQGTADTVVALGITPVAVEADPWGGDADGYQPWVREAIEERGDALPALITGGTEIDMDAVVAAKPDIILAPQSGLTQDQYDLLSQLAPTVAYPGEAWSTAWDEQIEMVGTALGLPDDAAELVSGITERLDTIAEAHPAWKDLSFAYVYSTSPGVLGVFQPSEPRAAILELMGLRSAEFIPELPVDAGTASSTLGLENADKLDGTDLVFSWFEDADNQAAIEAQPLYAQIPAVERGSDVVVYDHQFVTAASLITPLTVPWVLDDYVDLIEKATEKL